YVLNSALVQENEGSDNGQAWLSENDAGSGPFSITVGNEAQNISAAQFAEYWNFEENRPQEIEFRRIDLDATQAQEIAAGSIDISGYGLDYRSTQMLTDVEDVEVFELAPFNQSYIFFNMVGGPTTELEVRQAIELAIDY